MCTFMMTKTTSYVMLVRPVVQAIGLVTYAYFTRAGCNSTNQVAAFH